MKTLLLACAFLPAAALSQEPKVVDAVLSLIDTNYVDAVDAGKLKRIASRDGLAAVFKELDPYSMYLAPEAYKEMNTAAAGTFGGIGMTLQESGGGVFVISTIPGTPAYLGGVRAGEKIVAVDGASVSGLSLAQVVKRLRGQAGTAVALTLSAEGIEGTREVKLTREIIKIESARGRMIGPDTGYLQITQFSATTGEDVKRLLGDLKTDGMKRLVLDLRNNPGGLLSVAGDVAGFFLDSGKLIVYTQGRASARHDYDSTQVGLFADLPLALLVNGGTAAGSEILTGALQDYGRARIIGGRTYGKGSVQAIHALADGGALKLTVARYYSPKGRSIDRGRSAFAGGFIPDVVVDVSADAEKASRGYLESLLASGRPIGDVDAAREPVLARALAPSNRAAAAPVVKAEAEEALPAAVPANPDSLAVVFGIENYKKVGGVSFARRDAEAFRRYAVNLLGVPDSKNHIYFLTEDVTLAEFKKAFGKNGWLARRVKPSSDVYFFYAGHGAPDLDSKRGFLVPEDGDPNYAGETGYPIDELYAFLDGLKARSVSVFLDSCFSGADRENKMLLAQARPLVVSVKPPVQTKNLLVFSAASASQISSGYAEQRHGLFTFYLLKGLRGESDKNGDHRVTAGELEEYLKTKVADAAAGMDREQVPQLNGDPARVIVGPRRP